MDAVRVQPLRRGDATTRLRYVARRVEPSGMRVRLQSLLVPARFLIYVSAARSTFKAKRATACASTKRVGASQTASSPSEALPIPTHNLIS